MIVLIYTYLITINEIVNIDEPSYPKYLHFYSIHSKTMVCPCSKLAIDYENFIDIHFTRHPLCSSIFITDTWMEYLQISDIPLQILVDDFRVSGVNLFVTLRMFCTVTNETIVTGLREFFSKKYISATLMSNDALQRQIQTSFQYHISSLTKSVLFSSEVIRNVIHINGLWSARPSNYIVFFFDNVVFGLTAPIRYRNCSCVSDPICVEDFFVYLNESIGFAIPGLKKGCLLTEAVLQSDLRCFYNETYVSEIQLLFNNSKPMKFNALDRMMSSQFKDTSLLKEIIEKLMIETWNLSVTHENYFKQCQPRQCAYEDVSQHSFTFIITTAFSLIGGLVTILEILIPFLVKHIRKLIQSRNDKRSNVSLHLPICKVT